MPHLPACCCLSTGEGLPDLSGMPTMPDSAAAEKGPQLSHSRQPYPN
jgi:hypothetical protein